MDIDIENAEAEDILKQLIGPSEHMRSTLLVHSVSPSANPVDPKTSGPDTHVLSIVSNFDNVEEEGSVFIFKLNTTTQPAESSPEPSILLLATLPLISTLNISMAQSRPRAGTIDLRPGKFVPPSRPIFILTMEYARQTYRYTTESSESLAIFMTECRRLIKIANTSSRLDFQWLGKYQSHHGFKIPTLFPRPDLRQIQKPAYMSLSPAAAGQPGDENADIELIRDEWLRSKLDDDQTVFIEKHDIRIRIGTFNVNGKSPSQDLSPWIRPQHNKRALAGQVSLPPLKSISPISLSSFTASDYLSYQPSLSTPSEKGETSSSDKEPDIYVLGFQELDLSTEALIYSYTTTREEMWTEALFAALGEVRGQYTKVSSKQLVGMLVICIARSDLVKDINDVRTCTVGTGIMGMMGNKGAVALRLTLHSTVITFVNAHLAAFDEFIDRRNADFHDLSRRLAFPTPALSPKAENSELVDILEPSSESIFQSDVLFWIGGQYTFPDEISLFHSVIDLFEFNNPLDLNYRVDLPDEEVRQLIAKDRSTRNYNVRDMLSNDQLTKARLEGRAFEDFKEGEIQHFPSYRFSPGVATDTCGYDLKRRPAWTDRILYRSAPQVEMSQLSYDSHPELTMSDHKPVSAEFCVSVRKADESAYYRQLQNLVVRVGEIEQSEETPKLKLDLSEIQFGDVRYKQEVTRELVLQNTGKIPCAFRFVSLDENEPAVPPWFSALPRMGIVLPNEEQTISLTLYIDDSSAASLNIGDGQLQHTLILHTEHGKDHFVVMSGSYHPTCFANDLATLVRLPRSIRDIKTQKDTLAKEPKANAPREVIRLINWLMTNATDIPDLFLTHGDSQLIESIREFLDTGEEFSFDSATNIRDKDKRHTLALSFADTLLQFFQSLPTPIIPISLQQRCTRVADRDEAFEVVSTGLPGFSLNVWISLTAFLHFIAQQKISAEEKPIEGAKADVLACIFAPVLLRDEPGLAPQASPLAKRRFLLHFIQ